MHFFVDVGNDYDDGGNDDEDGGNGVDDDDDEDGDDDDEDGDDDDEDDNDDDEDCDDDDKDGDNDEEDGGDDDEEDGGVLGSGEGAPPEDCALYPELGYHTKLTQRHYASKCIKLFQCIIHNVSKIFQCIIHNYTMYQSNTMHHTLTDTTLQIHQMYYNIILNCLILCLPIQCNVVLNSVMQFKKKLDTIQRHS